MAGKPILSLNPKISLCVGNQTFDALSIVSGCSVSYVSIGDIVEWDDGTIATILDTAVPAANGWTTFATLLKEGGPVNRTNQPFTLRATEVGWPAPGTQISTYAAAFKDRIILKSFIGGAGNQAVTIDVVNMDTGNARHHARWSFPNPGPVGRLNRFVGEETAQTLTSKILVAPKIQATTAAVTPTWDTVNNEGPPKLWSPIRAPATGTNSLDYYETLTMGLRLTGHLGTIGGDSTTARYLTVRLVRIGKLVTMTIARWVAELLNSRPAGKIGTDNLSLLPTNFHPPKNMMFFVPVVSAGVDSIGRLTVKVEPDEAFPLLNPGYLEIGAGANGADFPAIPAQTPQWSGIQGCTVQWVMA